MSLEATFPRSATAVRHRRHPLSIFTSVWTHRGLIYRLSRREVESRYKGSLLGFVWSVLVPLIMVAVYTFVFSVIFPSQWKLPPGHEAPFFIIIFAGMICLNLFCETIGRAPGLMLNNVNYIKKVIFPLEILPIVVLFSELFNVIVSTIVLMAIFVWYLGAPPVTTLLLPVIIFPFMIMILGLLWIISALGVYLRDMRQLIAVILGMMGFVSPLFYPMSLLKNPALRVAVYLNPLTIPLEEVRHVLFWGVAPDWRLWAIYLIAAWLIAWAGLVWFSSAQRGFADVV